MKSLLVATGLALAGASGLSAPPRVTFDDSGTALVNGKPFFPIGLFTYSLDESTVAQIHQQDFNAVTLLTEHHQPSQLDWVQKEGWMAICPPGDGWLTAGTNHPALLAWYLADEPEGHDQSPASLREKYLKLKERDPNHPVALDHFLWEALINYKDACDVTMTSTYPILATNPAPITHVGLFIDHARSQHKPGWPHWPYIQIFGGPNTDGGKWKQPDPEEVRCMVYIALVHRANGIFYFSYWPKAPKTWEAVGVLNRELRRMTPWLVAPGRELQAKSGLPEVRVRARSVDGGATGIVLLVNTTPAPHYVEITIPDLPNSELRSLLDSHTFKPVKDRFTEKLAPYATRAYVWGSAPK